MVGSDFINGYTGAGGTAAISYTVYRGLKFIVQAIRDRGTDRASVNEAKARHVLLANDILLADLKAEHTRADLREDAHRAQIAELRAQVRGLEQQLFQQQSAYEKRLIELERCVADLKHDLEMERRLHGNPG